MSNEVRENLLPKQVPNPKKRKLMHNCFLKFKDI
jgi:hypothetical protein